MVKCHITRRKLVESMGGLIGMGMVAVPVTATPDSQESDFIRLEDSYYMATRKGYDLELVSTMEVSYSDCSCPTSINSYSDGYIHNYDGVERDGSLSLDSDNMVKAVRDNNTWVNDRTRTNNGTEISISIHDEPNLELDYVEVDEVLEVEIAGNYYELSTQKRRYSKLSQEVQSTEKSSQTLGEMSSK